MGQQDSFVEQVWDLYLKVSTQWTFSGFGVPTGLNYHAVSLVIDLFLPPDRFYRSRVFEMIQVIERTYLEVQSEKNPAKEEGQKSRRLPVRKASS